MATKKKGAIFIQATAPRPKTQTELKKRIRSVSYSDALQAVEWLNAAKGTPAYRRVLKVRTELYELAIMLDTLGQQWQSRRVKRQLTKQEIEHEQEGARLEICFRERHRTLVRTVAKYTSVPFLDFHIPTAAWRFDMVPKLRSGPTTEIEDGNNVVQITESSAIGALLRLATKRELFKVRLCENCGERWRVSERQLDRFCSDECRESFYKKSPKFKDRKARNQQRYRENLKRRKNQFS